MPAHRAIGNEREDPARAAASCLARRYHCDDLTIRTADASAENRAWLRARHPGLPIETVSADAVQSATIAAHGDVLKTEAVYGLARKLPDLSARRVLTAPQVVALVMLAAGLLAAAFLWPRALLHGVAGLLAAAFVVSGMFRAGLAFVGSGAPVRAGSRPRHGLPRYTILVPLYHEAAVLPGLVAALRALDYPRHLLDIKLVLEADDGETIAAAQACGDGFEIVEVPDHGPRTKPKAANYALSFARGEYLVIYDAEDRPEPDQLLKAVAAFRASPRALACVQARLNFYNADHNWLTRVLS